MAEQFSAGDRVVVSRARGRDRQYLGQAGEFVRYSHPNNYAVVLLDDRTLGPRQDGLVHVHPERLTRE